MYCLFRMIYGASRSRSPVCFIIGCFIQNISHIYDLFPTDSNSFPHFYTYFLLSIYCILKFWKKRSRSRKDCCKNKTMVEPASSKLPISSPFWKYPAVFVRLISPIAIAPISSCTAVPKCFVFNILHHTLPVPFQVLLPLLV